MKLKQDWIGDGYELLEPGTLVDVITEQARLVMDGHDPKYGEICFQPSSEVLVDPASAPSNVWLAKKYQK